MDFREVHQQSLTEMEELRKFQSSTFDTLARRKLIEDQNTILELSGRVQELQNEVNCMNDSKDFQDAESARSGNSHVTSRPVSFPPHPIPERNVETFFHIAEPQRRAANHLGHTWYIGKRFCKSTCIFISSLTSRIESMGYNNWGAASYVYSGEKWKANTRSRSEMPVWTVSQRFSHLQRRRLFKELWGRPTTTADFWSPIWQVPYTSHVCLLEDKVQDRGMYLFTISYGSNAMDQGSGVGWFSGWIEIFVIYSWFFNAELWSTWCEDHWTKSSIIPISREESVWRNKRPRSRTVSFVADRLLSWSTITSGSLESRILSKTMPTYSLSFYEMTIFRNSILSGTEFHCPWRKSRMMTSWKDCTN